MKKVLFATTALVASAGMASADVALSGMAEAGIAGSSLVSNPGFHTDIDVTFTMSGETDNGVSFGASIDLDESDGTTGSNASPAFAATSQGGESIFVSSEWGTLTLGDTDGAFDWAMIETATGAAGSIAADHTTHAGYNGNAGFDGVNDGQIARYDYSFGDFGFAVSMEIDDSNWPGNGTGVNTTVYGVGANYSMAMTGATVSFGAAYQGYSRPAAGNTGNLWGVSASAALDMGLTATANYSSANGTIVGNSMMVNHWGIGMAYDWQAWTFGANYGKYNRQSTLWNNGNADDSSGYGLTASYDFGGGLEIQAGYGWSNCQAIVNLATTRSGCGAALSNSSTFSLGGSMSF